MFRSTPSTVRRSAYTLIELLVVVVIIITLVAVTLPIAKKVLTDSRAREASRQLNGYLALAKTRAVQTGRPCGVQFQCDAPVGDTTGLRQVTRMYLAETPPPYIGSTLGARAKIYDPTGMNAQRQFVPVRFDSSTGAWVVDTAEAAILSTLIEPGEVFAVRFDLKGEWYLCQRLIGASLQFNYQGTLNGQANSAGVYVPTPPGFYDSGTSITPGMPFQVLRQPRRIGNPLEMSTGTCIDLMYSGFGPSGAGSPVVGGVAPLCGGFPADGFLAAAQPTIVASLTIMFSPGGSVDKMYVNNLVCTPSGTIHLLVGKVEKISPPLADNDPNDPTYTMNMFDPENSNLADPNALWVSIGRTNGAVNTAENIPPVLTGNSPPSLTFNYVAPSGVTQSLTISATTPSGPLSRASYVEMCRVIASGHAQMGGQ